jgi:hypothetical protein
MNHALRDIEFYPHWYHKLKYLALPTLKELKLLN